jgi:glycosyltransferase involved in cell wall biosynthesis
MHGKLSHHQLAQLLNVMDCLVLPSRIESFGRVVMEALAAGIPAIVTPSVGAAEAIAEEKNGWIVPTGSAVALSKQMSLCCAEPSRAREMRPNCIASAARHRWVDYRRRTLSIAEAVVSPNWKTRDDCQPLSFVANRDANTASRRAYPN